MKINPQIAKLGNDTKHFRNAEHPFCTEAGEDDIGADTYYVPGSVLIQADLQDQRSCQQQHRGLLQTRENTTFSVKAASRNTSGK